MIEFVDLPVPPMTKAREENIQYITTHWVVTEDGLEWRPCNPACEYADNGYSRKRYLLHNLKAFLWARISQ